MGHLISHNITQQSDTLKINTAEKQGRRLNWGISIFRKGVFRKLQGIVYGKITLIDSAGTTVFGSLNNGCALEVTVNVYNLDFYRAMTVGGSIGVGESYMKGHWHSSNLVELVRIIILNRDVLDNLERGLAYLGRGWNYFWHVLRRNTLIGSRKNISLHYDLGNEFFQLFLDPTMMYSAAIFETKETTLHAASLAKMDRICKKLELKPTDHLLEIGTGWGGLAIHAAQHYGCRVTTTTISARQHEVATVRVQQAGLADKVTVMLQDYRCLKGTYDKLVSIEMIEAIGYQYYDEYLRICSTLLEPEGLMVLQSITIDDRQFDIAKYTVDFIQRYIFPGGCLPSVTAICNSLQRATDMRLFHLEDIGPHYATTLQRWRENFFKNLTSIRQLGYSENFIRMWEYYLCYCEGGFAERFIGTVQLVLTKPSNRCDAI